MKIKIVLTIFMVVFLEIAFSEDEPKEGDTGVCIDIVSKIEKVRKTFKCGGHRTCSRMEQQFVRKKKPICCDGWKFYKGKCVPEGPVCDDPCVNAQCTGNNNCRCNPGLIALNDTHCGPSCAVGYYNDLSVSTFICKSKCSQQCINGTCEDFDTCSCNKGYRLKASNKFECEPECKICENGVCVEPNKCNCNDGYAKNKSDICTPVCTQPCNNGYCSSPEKCSCNSGYFYDEGLQTCVPFCKEKCVNYSSCISPDKCECWSGYNYSNASASCKPYCSSCSNGDCIAPEVCQCEKGYERNNNTCELIPLRNCKGCEATCNETVCACANGTLCMSSTEEAIVASTPTLAGLQLTWMLGGALGILLLIFVLVLIHRTWRQRKDFKQKANKKKNYHERESVMYTRPDTLIRKPYQDADDNEDRDYDEVEYKQTSLDLLPKPYDLIEKL